MKECFLAEALDDKPPAPKPRLKGMLAEFKAVLDRIPKGGTCLGEAEDRVQLYEYRR